MKGLTFSRWILWLQLMMLLLLVGLESYAQGNSELPEKVLAEGASFRGLSVVTSKVCWVSGNKGNVFRTTDGGRTWQKIPTPGGDTLEFRDVQALSAKEAWLMSAGRGKVSRIYHTSDGGANWNLQFQMQDSLGFLDAISFWDTKHGIAVGDPVNGRLDILHTEDGGEHWNRLEEGSRPPALEGEQIFAASGTSLAVHADHVWVATGGSAARVFRSSDRGRTWQVASTEMPHGTSAQGIFSICIMDEMHGLIAGGDYERADSLSSNVMFTSDGGVNWTAIDEMPFISCIVSRGILLSVAGSSFSRYSMGDRSVYGKGYHVVSISENGERIYAAGSGGRVSVWKVPASWRKRAALSLSGR